MPLVNIGRAKEGSEVWRVSSILWTSKWEKEGGGEGVLNSGVRSTQSDKGSSWTAPSRIRLNEIGSTSIE